MRYLLAIIFTLSFLINKAQFCSTASVTNMGVINPGTTMLSITVSANAKRYWTFSGVAGCTYTFSSCTSINTNDTYLRLYSGTSPLSAVLIASNDDNGPVCTGTKASIVWNCTTSGAYSILLTNYSCANLSSSTHVEVYGDTNLVTTGDMNMYVGGNFNQTVSGEYNLNVTGPINTTTGAAHNQYARANINTNAGANHNADVRGNYKMEAGGASTMESRGNMTKKAPRIDLNP